MKKSNIVLITIDSLRADHCSFMGYNKPTTPFLNTLSRDSIVFLNAYTSAPHTPGAVSSLITGSYPIYRGRYEVQDRVTISSLLREAGFTTFSIHYNGYITLMGCEKGFDTVINGGKSVWKRRVLLRGIRDGITSRSRNKLFMVVDYYAPGAFVSRCGSVAATLVAAISRIIKYSVARILLKVHLPEYASYSLWISEFFKECINSLQNEHQDKPFFIWLHYVDTHFFYIINKCAYRLVNNSDPSECRTVISSLVNLKELKNNVKYLIRAYDASIRLIDAALKDIYDFMCDKRLLDNTYIIITSDHGEEFFEHEEFGHMFKLYNEVLRIPLVIHGSNVIHHVVSSPVSLTDIYPTLVKLAINDNTLATQLLGSQRIRNIIDGTALIRRQHKEVIPEDLSDVRTIFFESYYAPPGIHLQSFNEYIEKPKGYIFGLLYRNRYKYMCVFKRGHGLIKREAYDIIADPRERNNLAGDDSSKELIKMLDGVLKRYLLKKARRDYVDVLKRRIYLLKLRGLL